MIKKNKQIVTIRCIDCQKEKEKVKNYYDSKSKLYSANGKIPLCKSCISSRIDYNDMETIFLLLKELNIVFDIGYWQGCVDKGGAIFGKYMSKVNSLPQLEGLTWEDSIFDIKKNNTEIITIEDAYNVDIVNSPNDDRNRQDVLKLLGHDPFSKENESDKPWLYGRLIDMLDESTLEDGFKLSASISIVKSFNQADKIDSALATLTSDVANVHTNTTAIKGLVQAKKQIMDSALALAKDNGISVNHNNNKSKGAGTLSGIIKALQEKGINEGEVNLFDIETSIGMRQVADLSNASIMDQLQFDENDYSAMLIEQRDTITKLDSRVINLEEENRLLKIELLKYRNESGVLNE